MTVGTIEKRRRRRSATAPAERTTSARGWVWSVAQITIVGAEVFAALFLLAQPAFRPRQVEVLGTTHLTPAQIIAALALPPDRNILFLNHSELEQRLTAMPWVRSASVSLALPDRVTATITEWNPSAVLQVGEATYAMNDLGQVLDPAAEAGGLTVINRPDFGPVAYGQRAVDRDLLPMLLQLKAGFAPAFKISLMSFELDRRDVLTAQTDRGWTIVFGQMLTGDDRATLTPKLAALRALASRVDFTSGQIQYINLENPGAPAVQMRARK